MKLIRYSLYGFKPKLQTYHLNGEIGYHLSDRFNIDNFPEYIRESVMKTHNEKVKFYTEHLEDLKCGIWCFIDGYKSNLALNHLKRKVPCWEAELPDNTECYDCNWERLTTISDSIILYGGCYIPQRELIKLRNIRKRHSNCQ